MINKYIYIVGFSEFASRMNFIAMTAMLLSFENTAWYLTVFFLVRQIGGIATSFMIRRYVDNHSRKRLMFWSDVASGFFILIPLIFQHPLAICVSAFFLGCTYEVFYISYSSSIPDMVGKSNALRTNARIIRISSSVSIIGFVTGGWLSEFLGYEPIIIFDSISYFLAALFVLKLHWKENVKEDKQPIQHIENFRMQVDNPGRIIVIFSVTAFFYSLAISGFNYSLPFLATSFNYDSFINGLFWSMTSLGALVGASLRTKATIGNYLVWLIFLSISISSAYLTDSVVVIILFLLLAGLFDGLAQVSGRTVLQSVPSVQRGRAFSIQAMQARFGFLVGFILCPFLVENLELNGSVWILQSLLAAICLIVYRYKKEGNYGKCGRDFIQ